ncbi:MAG: hypothetical protein AAB229_00980 [Candidatus Hydrogenedentota bacterium]
MTATLEEYKSAVRQFVCDKCVCFEAQKGKPEHCAHEASGACPIFEHLQEVVEVVRSVKSEELTPYIDELRQKVCCKCRHQNAEGFCELRDSVAPVPAWCMLDSYISLVVNAVERVQAGEAAA